MLDASIPLSLKTVDFQPAIKNFQDVQAQDANLRDMAQQRDLRSEQLKSARLASAEEARKAHEDQTLRGLAQINDVTTTQGQDQFLADAKNLGLGHKVPEFSAAFDAQRKAAAQAKADALKAERQTHIDFLDLRSRLLPGVKDQASYDETLGRLKRMGDDLSGLEPTFDAAKVKEHIGEVFTHKDRLEQENKADEAKAKASILAETTRHNKADERNGYLTATKLPASQTKNAEFNALPVESQELVRDLSRKNAQKTSIANQIAGDLAQYRKARGMDENGKPIPGARVDNDRALKIGNGMVKTLNSKEGADAVGAEEASRLATALQFQVNPLNMKGGQRLGRDFEAFDTQIGDTYNGIMGGIKANNDAIDKAYGRSPKTAAPAEQGKPWEAKPPAPHPQDSEAVTWAKANPKDPRSAAILKVNGF